ncbi:hypothetical protein [Pontibaca salina]|uniref:Glycosyltransferase n=1 Tax=Pontibaca salina TaxID=2795731 RepID=A0A934HMK5_9RHOB|nr:hypothetical protein [Pontibaca salina]MBI6630994.1 hypothetical protein [Pontibaca salina]
MPILHRTEDPHQIYTEAFRHLSVNGQPPIVVASRLKAYTSSYYPVRVVLSALAALFLVVDIYRARPRQHAVFVREFWTIPLLVTAPLIWPVARSVLFNVNHNLTGASDSVPWPIRLLARLGFQFVLFDGASSLAHFPAQVRPSLHTPLFPSVAPPRPRLGHALPIRVGLVGSIGSIGAKNELFFRKLTQIANEEDIELYYGARDDLPEPLRLIDGLRIYDTRSRENFRAYLELLDIAIFVASAESYYYRHSGTVMDAVSSGVIPVVPGFPVLRSQVSMPCPVGVYYDAFNQLPNAVCNAVAEFKTLSTNRTTWHGARAMAEIILGPRT